MKTRRIKHLQSAAPATKFIHGRQTVKRKSPANKEAQRTCLESAPQYNSDENGIPSQQTHLSRNIFQLNFLWSVRSVLGCSWCQIPTCWMPQNLKRNSGAGPFHNTNHVYSLSPFHSYVMYIYARCSCSILIRATVSSSNHFWKIVSFLASS